MSRLAGPTVIATLLILGQPVASQAVTQDQLRGQIDDAQRRVDDLEQRLDDATERYEQTWASIEETQVELAELHRSLARHEQDAENAEQMLGERAREVFKQGSAASFEMLPSSGGSRQAVERAAMISTSTPASCPRLSIRPRTGPRI